jgi:hypothetical protein
MKIHELAEDAICFDGTNPYQLKAWTQIIELSELRELLEKKKTTNDVCTWDLIDELLAELSSVDASSAEKHRKKGLEKVTK